MFGIGAGFMDSTAKYYLSGSWLILLIAFVGAYPLPANLGSKLYRKRGNLPMVVSAMWFGVLLLLCIAAMTSNTYASFLYFQF